MIENYDEQTESAWQGLYLACYNRDLESAFAWVKKLLYLKRKTTIL